MIMKHRIPLLAAVIAALVLPGMASAASTRLDIDQLRHDIVHDGVRRTVLAVDGEGRPLSVLLRIGKGQVLPPHGESGGVRLLTVISGTLSWGDGDKVDPAAERSFGPGSVIVIPARGGMHWAAARRDDVLIQVVAIGTGALSPEANAQVAS
jgi:quercetin dioxygenase-like cupin family protein